MKTLLLLGRPACELCEQLEDQLFDAFDGLFALDWRDVDRQPRWRELYGERIPVLLDEQENLLCEAVLDHAKVAAFLTDGGRTV